MDRDDSPRAAHRGGRRGARGRPGHRHRDASFKEDLDADSLDLVEVVMALEERFSISVPEDKLDGDHHRRRGHRPRHRHRRAGRAGRERQPGMTREARARVAVIGMGVKSPGRQRPRDLLGQPPARDGRPRPASAASTRPTCPVQFAGEVADFDPAGLPRLQGGPAGRPGGPARLRGRGRRPGRRRRPRRRPRPLRRGGRHRRGRAHHPGGAGAHPVQQGRVAGQPHARPDDDGQRHRRPHRHEARLDGPELLRRHRLRRRLPRHRRGRLA